MIANFPFAFSIDHEPGGINDHFIHLALAGEAVFDVEALGSFADTAIAMQQQRHRHQLEQSFKHQGSADGSVTTV